MGAISLRNVEKSYGSGAKLNKVIHGVSAEIADHHRPERPREVLTEVDQAHTFERVHHATPTNFAMSAAE